MANPYASGLDRNAANYVPLTPLSFIERSAYVFPDRLAAVHGKRRYTWKQTYERCRRLASALVQRGGRRRRHRGGDAQQHAGDVSNATSACR